MERGPESETKAAKENPGPEDFGKGGIVAKPETPCKELAVVTEREKSIAVITSTPGLSKKSSTEEVPAYGGRPHISL
ncbi:g11093 [Coccomyxa viridis]|uniref:G11093 protein n=1 Tax=Coccomyxa viridis TaxID=1274662 RepID=A0ABP1G9T5_9CHLO